MSLLAGITSAIVTLLAVLLAYAGVCLALLFYLAVPDEPPYHLIEDATFVVTLPFVLVVLLASAAANRRSYGRP